MKQEILANLNNPGQLEKLYRDDKPAFKRTFNALYPDLQDNALAGFWHARLNYAREEVAWGSRKELVFVIILSIIAALIAKLPAILNIDKEFFYPRNIGFIIVPVLSVYFASKNQLPAGKIALIAGATLACLLFINTLPGDLNNDILVLSCIHLFVLLWFVLGFAFVGEMKNNVAMRLGFLRYNGDLLVMTGLIAIAGFILSAVTIGLFSLIGINIEKFYFENVVIAGLSAAPVIATYLTQMNPQLVGKVSTVIAKIFSPLVLVMLVIYLIAMIYSGKDPYNDREFLLMFNGLQVGVMAIIFFSIAGTSRTSFKPVEIWVLLFLSIVTIIVNGVALSAILFRISEWGVSPNRTAILGGNILILVNLFLVTAQLYRVVSKKTGIEAVGNSISFYLPVYCAWAIIVTFIFPIIF